MYLIHPLWYTASDVDGRANKVIRLKAQPAHIQRRFVTATGFKLLVGTPIKKLVAADYGLELYI
jgi:hypothetical protein